MFVYVGCLGSDHGHGPCTRGMWHPTAVEDIRHAWMHRDRAAMADWSHELLGLQANASVGSIKCAFRTLAKQYHPDKNNSPDATKTFQKLNTAYQILTSLQNELDRDDGGINDSDSDGSIMTALPNVTLLNRENSFSVTIDIIDIMFLVFMEECEFYHNVRPIDRGPNGIQYRFDYTSPDDAENYGSLSLTFYATTSRLLVQGTSYLLWVDEHLPAIYKRAESRYTEDLGTWRSLTRRRGIGLRRNARTTRQTSLRQAQAPISDAACTDDGQVIAPHEPEIPTVHDLRSSDDSDVPSGHPLPSPSKLGCHNFPTIPLAILGSTHDIVTTSVTSVGTPQSEAGSDTKALTASEVLPDPLSPHQRACTDREVSTSEVSASAAGRINKVGNGKSATSTDNDNKKSKKTKKGPKSKSVKSKNSADTTSSNVSHCYSDCVDQGRADANMIRCSICILWIHISCSGEDKRNMGARAWKNCRNIPSAITAMQSKLASLETFIKGTRDNNQDLVNEIRLLRTENGNLKQKLASVNQHNSELKKLIETMSEQSCAQTPHEPLPMQPSSPQSTATGRDVPGPGVTTQNRYAALAALDDGPTGPTPATTSQHQQPRRAKRPTPNPMTVTIVGSSIVRGVAPLMHGKDCDVSGYVYPGRTARQINAQIKHIPSSDVTVLAAGTNNIDSHPLWTMQRGITTNHW